MRDRGKLKRKLAIRLKKHGAMHSRPPTKAVKPSRQRKAPAKKDGPTQAELEKAFSEKMTNSALVGHFTDRTQGEGCAQGREVFAWQGRQSQWR